MKTTVRVSRSNQGFSAAYRWHVALDTAHVHLDAYFVTRREARIYARKLLADWSR